MKRKPASLIPTAESEFGLGVLCSYELATGLCFEAGIRMNKLPLGATIELYKVKEIAEKLDRESREFGGPSPTIGDGTRAYLRLKLEEMSSK